MDYKTIFNDALSSASVCELNTNESSKLSLFAFMHNYVLAAQRLALQGSEPSSTEALSKLLLLVIKMPRGKRYMGLKTEDIQATVQALLCDEQGKLHSELLDYEYTDLLQYLEICKRVFHTGYKPTEGFSSLTETPVQKDEVALPWSEKELAELLFNGDKEAATYILEHQTSFSSIQIKIATSVRGNR
jgi:hypothetical protein